MEYAIYSQEDILHTDGMADRLLDMIIQNLSYLFGADMGSPENRDAWKLYNLQTADPAWQCAVGSCEGNMAGFIIYTVKARVLCIHDFEISGAYRRCPALITGLLETVFQKEQAHFDCIEGYINGRNSQSQRNFLKYATAVSQTAHGYHFTISKEKVRKIASRMGLKS